MRIKMSKKGRADRNAIDSVLDDLLGSDVEEKKKPTEKSPVKKLTNKSAKVSLTSKASDAEFYKNLKILADNSTVSKQDDDEEESLSDEGVKKLADDIGDLDDLDSNLFANLKSNQKKNQDKSVKSIKVLKKEKTTATKAYDIDDPLADLLSDNDSIKVSKKSVAVKKTKKNKESTDPDASSQSLSNNGEKAKSLDSRRSQVELPADNNNYISPDKSIVEQTNEKFQQGKKSVDSAETSTLKNIDSNETDTVLSKKPATDLTKSPNKKKHSKKVIDDDIFGDSDGLPDMSDEEVSNKPFKKAKSSDDAIPPEKATTALDNLLNVGKAVSPRKNPAPMTMLEQIMSGTRKKDNPESKPEEISFGNYSPSIGNQSERPANTANLRSVRFAADLGFDDDQLLSSSPKSSSLKKKSSNLKTSPRGLNSSIDGAFNDGLSKPSRSREQNIVSRKEDVLKTSKSSDDWLELGDDLTDQFVGSNDLLSSKRGKPLHKSVNNARSPGDWLESVDDLTDQLGSNNLLPPRRAKSINKQIKNEKNREKKNDGSFLESSDQKSGLLDASDYKKSSTTNQAKENEKKETSLEEPDDFLSLLKKKKKQKENLASRHPQQVIEPQEVAEDSQVGQSKFHMKSEERENQSQLTNSLQSSHPNLLEQQLQSNQTFQQKFVVPPNQLIQQQSFDLEKQQQYLQHLSQQSSLALLHQQQLQFQQQVLNTPLTFIPNISPMIIEATKSENIKKLAGEELSTFTLQPEQTRANLKDFHERYLKLEEEKSQSNMDYTTKIYELESKIKSLELECQYLSSWQKSAKLRHQEELSALELSHKMRVEYVEESYKRRLKQMEDDFSSMKINYDEKINHLMSEQQEQQTAWKRKLDLKEQTHFSDMERLNEAHKRVLTNLTQEHDDRIRQIHIIKKQEVEAAINAFSHAKSFQGLVEEVKSSTKEVNNLQEKLATDYQSRLHDQEISLQMRNEQLENMFVRLQQREKMNEEERVRLQTLVSRLEMQLRDQTRLIEQDKWKINQEENRLKTLQHVLDEDRRITSQQLQDERAQIAKAREDMLAEQRKLIAECYEEKRLINEEKLTLSALQREAVDVSRSGRRSAMQAESDFETAMSRYKLESSTFNARLAHVQQEESRLTNEKEELVKREQLLSDEHDRLREVARVLQDKSKEVEDFAMEAKNLYDESIRSKEQTEVFRTHLENFKNQLERKALTFDQKEAELIQEQDSLEDLRRKTLEASQRMTCLQCKGFFSPGPYNSAVPLRAQSSIGTTLRQNDSLETIASKAILTSTPDLGAITNPARTFNSYTIEPSNLNEPSKTEISNKSALYSDCVKDSSHGLDICQRNAAASRSYKSLQVNPKTKDFTQLPPDLLLNDLEYRSHLRKWDSAKERDDGFIEEETRFLEALSQKRK